MFEEVVCFLCPCTSCFGNECNCCCVVFLGPLVVLLVFLGSSGVCDSQLALASSSNVGWAGGLYDAPIEKERLTVFVDNVLDKHYHPDIADQASTFGSTSAVDALVPRDFSTYAGIKVSAQF